ncbi:hypothetical protein evm_008394 [Chilo suppressalis]|nr:hypothetical protein evm_008394 [Chilo suppressalis]
MESSSKSDISTFYGQCRCCLEYGYMKNLWTEHNSEGIREVFGEMLLETFSINWETVDELKDYICESCVIRLRDAYEFKKEVLSSQQLISEGSYDFEQDSDYKVEMLEESDELENADESEEVSMEEEQNDIEVKTDLNDTEYFEVEYLEDDETVEVKDETLKQTDTKSDMETDKPKTKWPRKKKPNEIVKQYKDYSEEDMRQCLELVRSNKMSISDASKLYGIPRKTVAGKISYVQKKKLDASWIEEDMLKRRHLIPEVKKHRHNIRVVLENSNATPFRSQAGTEFTCNYCAKAYSQPHDLKRHTLLRHRDVTKVSEVKVATGYSIKMDVTNLKCRLCREKFDLLEDLMSHLSQKHDFLIHKDVTTQMVPFKFDGDKLKCAVCSMTFNFFKSLAEHMSLHYSNFECELCGAVFITKQRYKVHEARQHSNKGRVYYCSFCPKSFANQMKTRDHERVIHINENRTKKCGYCKEKFRTVEEKLNHERSVHGGTCRLFKCCDCGQYFETHVALNAHAKKLHSIAKPFKCEICGLLFYRQPSLTLHMAKKHADVDVDK